MFPLAQMMDHDWGGHADSTWGWIVMTVLMVLLVAVVAVVALRLTTRTAVPPSGGPNRSAEDLLADRLARGEIDVEEYRQRRDVLRSS
jgi:putative membrane protein